MTTLATLVVKIIGDVADYLDAIQKSTETTDSFASTAVNGLSAVGGTVVAGALAAGAAGVAALGKATWDATQEAMAAQEVQSQLEAVLKSTGGAAGVTAQMANDLANQYASLTTFEDDAILSGENMLLTFTNIGKEVFPATTQTMLDMSQALGQDLKSSAMQLGKALNDPVSGITALTRVGVTFSDEQKSMIETMVKAGDTAGAQKVILAELNKEFGGSAESAGKNAAGTWIRLQHIWGNVLETVGGALLPTITNLGQALVEYLERPETQVFVQQLAEGIAAFASTAIAYLPQVVQWFQTAFGWLEQNQGVIVAALAMIGAAVVTFAVTSLSAAIPGIVAFVAAAWPVVLVLGVIGGAAYLLYEAWTNNWGGIQEKMGAVWAWMQPIFEQLKNWFQNELPIHITALGILWETVMLPKIQAVWSWMSSTLFPFFKELATFIGFNFLTSTSNLASTWQTTLYPALEKIVGFLQAYVFPAIKRVNDMFFPWQTAIQGVSGAIREVTGWLATMNSTMAAVKLPKMLTPGSPTPFENGLRGIGDALDSLNGKSLPALRTSLEFDTSGVGAIGAQISPRIANGQQGSRAQVPVTIQYYDQSIVSAAREAETVDKLAFAVDARLRQLGVI